MRIEKHKNYWVVFDENQIWLVTKHKDIANHFMKKNQKKLKKVVDF
jgi:hypothetical protein